MPKWSLNRRDGRAEQRLVCAQRIAILERWQLVAVVAQRRELGERALRRGGVAEGVGVGGRLLQDRLEVRDHLVRLRGDVRADDLPGLGVNRPLPGDEHERTGEHGVREAAIGGRRAGGKDMAIVQRVSLAVAVGSAVERAPTRDAWAGLRPMLPNGLPAIGRARAIENLYVAAGHSTLGVTLGPLTGQRLAELIVDGRLHPALAPFAPR